VNDEPIRRPLDDLTVEEQTALLGASLEVELRELGRAGAPEFHEEDDLAWVVGAWPGATVYRTALDAGIADRRIAALVDRFDREGLDATWWAGPASRPDDLRERLERHGFALSDDEAGMAADLHALVEDLPRPDGLRFETFGGRDDAIDPRLVEAWLSVAGAVFGWPPERYDVRRRLYLGDDRRPRPWRHLVGFLDGRPVAMARVLLAAGVAMVHGVAVLQEARRQGIGSAITLAALLGARAEGYRVAVLQASSMGRGPYERIGFRTVASYGRFERPTAGGAAQDATAAPTTVEAGPRPGPAAGESAAPDLPVLDAWCFVGPYRSRPPGTPYEMDDLLAEHERLGVGARLCLHAESRDGVPEEGNAAMSRIAVVSPNTGVIWSVLPPRRFGGMAADRLLGDAQAAGVAMFALFPRTHAHHSAPWANGDLYGAMEAARLPLVLDLEQTSYEEVYAIASAHRRLPIVLWGAWYVDERLLVPLLDACPSVRVGLAGDRHIFNPTFGVEQFTARYGPSRLIFGSGWPRQSPGPYLTYVRYAAVAPHVRDAILGDSVRELLAGVRWTVRGFEARPE